MPLVQKYDLYRRNKFLRSINRAALESVYGVEPAMVDAEIDVFGHSGVSDSVIAVFHGDEFEA